MTGLIAKAVSYLLNPPWPLAIAIAGLSTALVAWRNLHAWGRDQRFADDYLSMRQRPVLNDEPLVSVLTAVWNREDDLDALIQSFLSVAYPNKELIVAAGGAHRLTQPATPGVMLIEHPGGGKLAALARCLEVAKGEILYLTDGDCRLSADGFLELIAPIANGDEDVTTGRHAPLVEQRDDPFIVAQWAHQTWGDTYIYRSQRTLIGSNAAIRRSALESIGGFDFDAPIAEDGQLGRLLVGAGFRIQQVPHSIVETHYHSGFLAYMQQVARWQRGNLFLTTANTGRLATIKRMFRNYHRDLGLLTLTALSPFGGRSLQLLLYVLLLRRCAERLRQLAFLVRVGLVRWRWSYPPFFLLQTYLYALSRLLTLFQLSSTRHRRRW